MTVDVEDDGYVLWRRQTERIIAWAEVAFSGFVLVLYFGALNNSALINSANLTRFALILFLLIGLGRLAFVYYRKVPDWFGWASATIDILFLSGIIYIFSLQYGSSAASLMSPSFAYYFFFIALHAMRFDTRLVIGAGLLSSLAWATMLSTFVLQGTSTTHSYAEYISTTNLLVGAEVEKIISLIVFTIMLGLGVKRASEVLEDAADKRVAEVKMHEAEKTAQMKTEFLANMSHEIRTPMNGVLGMVQVLRNSDLRPDQAEHIDTIQRSGDALLTIINDILDFSKIEAGKLRLDATSFDLRQACEDVVTLLGTTARNKGLDLILNLLPDVPLNLLGDAGRLRQILTNLIGNAIKFTETGYVMCEIRGVERDGVAHLSITVKDTGIGIAPEKLASIFDEFSQVDGSATRRFGGTGLGLSISKSLVEAMGGELSVVSNVGQGSTFTFTADLLVDRRKHKPKAQAGIVDLTEVPILIVDDLAVNSDILKLQLRQMGAAPDVVDNARDAVISIRSAQKAGRPYAILVTDYQMPDINGLELVQSIRKRPDLANLQIIVLSSIDDEIVRNGFLKEKVSAYMTKPSRYDDFEDSIFTAAARYKTLQLAAIAKANRISEKDDETSAGVQIKQGG